MGSIWCLLGHDYIDDYEEKEVRCRRCGKVNHGMTYVNLAAQSEVMTFAKRAGWSKETLDEYIEHVVWGDKEPSDLDLWPEDK